MARNGLIVHNGWRKLEWKVYTTGTQMCDTVKNVISSSLFLRAVHAATDFRNIARQLRFRHRWLHAEMWLCTPCTPTNSSCTRMIFSKMDVLSRLVNIRSNIFLKSDSQFNALCWGQDITVLAGKSVKAKKYIVTLPVTWVGRSEKLFYFSHFFRMSIGGNRCFLTYSPVLWYMVLNVELWSFSITFYNLNYSMGRLIQVNISHWEV